MPLLVFAGVLVALSESPADPRLAAWQARRTGASPTA
jgi:hypothetical protein